MSLSKADEIIRDLSKPFDPRQIKQRKIGGRQVDYVGGEAYIARINRATPAWSMRVTKEEIRDLTVMRWDEATRKRVPTVVPCQIVHGELEIPGVGIRSGIGVQLLEDGAGEDVVKGALTDCLKNCAKYFGLGLHLYSEGAPLIYEDAPQGAQDAPGAQNPADVVSGHQQSRMAEQGAPERDAAWTKAKRTAEAVAAGLFGSKGHDVLKIMARHQWEYTTTNQLTTEQWGELSAKLESMQDDRELLDKWYDRWIAPNLPQPQQEAMP